MKIIKFTIKSMINKLFYLGKNYKVIYEKSSMWKSLTNEIAWKL